MTEIRVNETTAFEIRPTLHIQQTWRLKSLGDTGGVNCEIAVGFSQNCIAPYHQAYQSATELRLLQRELVEKC